MPMTNETEATFFERPFRARNARTARLLAGAPSIFRRSCPSKLERPTRTPIGTERSRAVISSANVVPTRAWGRFECSSGAEQAPPAQFERSSGAEQAISHSETSAAVLFSDQAKLWSPGLKALCGNLEPEILRIFVSFCSHYSAQHASVHQLIHDFPMTTVFILGPIDPTARLLSASSACQLWAPLGRDKYVEGQCLIPNT